MAAGAVSLKNLTKCEEVRKLEKELIRLYVIVKTPKVEYAYDHATLDYGSALWYWEFPHLKYWLNLLDFGIEKNFSFIIVD